MRFPLKMTENESEGRRGDVGDQLEGSSPSRGVAYESRGSEQSWNEMGSREQSMKMEGHSGTWKDLYLHGCPFT